MAREIINIGTTANDGTGDTLRDSMDKSNDNFLELYNVAGWGNYSDGGTTPTTQTITSTPSKLLIDALGGLTNEDYLPREIRGISSLWDGVNDKMNAISEGDSYSIRLNLELTTKGGLPTHLFIVPDIGGAAGITIPIPGAIVSVETGSLPLTLPVYFKVFSLATFIANGCQIFLNTDTGTLTLADRTIYIEREYKGSL